MRAIESLGATVATLSTASSTGRRRDRTTFALRQPTSCYAIPSLPSVAPRGGFWPGKVKGNPAAAMSGLSGSWFCDEVNGLIDSIRVAGDEAIRVRGEASVKSNPSYKNASAFVYRHDKVFGAPLYGASCESAVREGKQHLANLNRVISGGIFDTGGGTTVNPDITTPEGSGPLEALGSIKTIAIAAAVIAGAALLAPIVIEAVGSFKALRRR